MNSLQPMSYYKHALKNIIIELQIITARYEKGQMDDLEFIKKVEEVNNRLNTETKEVQLSLSD